MKTIARLRGPTWRPRQATTAASWLLVALVALQDTAAMSATPSTAPAPPPAPQASTASPAPPAPPADDKAAPASVPIPEVARQADEVAKVLRDFDALLAPSPAAEAAEKRLPDITARIAT